MATPVRFGDEFLVNVITTNLQIDSSVAALADGRFAACWTDQSASADLSAAGIRAQLFNADGSPSGLSFPVNTTTAMVQNQPSIAALTGNRFVVTWTDQSATGGDTSNEAIRAQIFNADGTTNGGEFIVNSTTAFDQRDSSITALAGGGFVVTWNDPSDGTSGRGIRAQIFDANGSASGAEFVVNTTRTAEQNDPSVVGLAGGGFAVCWMDYSATGGPGGDPSGRAIRAQAFDANGTALANSGLDFVVNSTTAGDQFEPAITALANGGFAVSWTDGALAGNNSSVRARMFDALGAPTSAEFLVNTTTANNQHDSSAAGLADGRVVFCWVDFSVTGDDTTGAAIRAQVFNADGTKSGGEFLVNTITLSNQTAPSIATLADGRFMVSWTDGSNTLGAVSGQDIRAQIFDPREAAVKLIGTALGDQWVGTGFKDRMAGGAGNDWMSGDSGADRLNGGRNNDTLLGGNGADKLTGGYGRDTMTGGAGADDFIYVTAADSAASIKRDIITDFEHLTDDLDFSSFLPGGSFIDAADFGNVAGQIRYSKASGILQGDVTGDGKADFEINIGNKPVISAEDLIF